MSKEPTKIEKRLIRDNIDLQSQNRKLKKDIDALQLQLGSVVKAYEKLRLNYKNLIDALQKAQKEEEAKNANPTRET
jgi:regulator of replication initiation timing